MPYECYVPKSFNAEHDAIIGQANRIIAAYQAQGYVLTLRQLYYQFVARDLIPNNMRSYKRLGGIIKDGRLAGLIDWEAIEDRTRELQANAHWESTAQILRGCANQFRYDLWLNQPHRVEVWIEKEALVGVIEAVCKRNDVSYLACRGNVSISEQWAAAKRFADYTENHQEVTIIHLGDHDPSGIDMTRDNQDQQELFGRPIDQVIEVKRIALNWDQIQHYNPPPNPAKTTDSRYKAYVQRFGEESWELDALEPQVIVDLIQDTIDQYRDPDLWDEAKVRQAEARERLAELANQAEDEED